MRKTPLSDNPLATRANVQNAVADLFAPLLPNFSDSGARVSLAATSAHFDTAAAELEGFARPLWGIVPLSAGGGSFEHWELYRKGLANGTDPQHADYWGDISDYDQRQVELAAIALGLRMCTKDLWDPLDARAKANVAAYLIAGRDHTFVDSNWRFFRVLVDMALTHCGVEFAPRDTEDYLDQIERFTLGNGWYRDGNIKSADHYIPFAFHYYGLIYAALSGDETRAARFRERAKAFAADIRHWHGPDGAALPFGRSLIYRFAHAGFWGALGFADVEALPWGEIKGYYLRNLRWWARQPIFDRDGVLSIGFAYPNLMVSEGYNSPGSPYWAMKAFLPLALPETHPFWTAEETEPEPVEKPVPLSEAGMVVQHLDGHNVALSSGQDYRHQWRGMAEKYGRFAYSTRYGFSIEASDRHFDNAASDNMLSLSIDGRHFRMREACELAEMADDCLRSVWHPFDDVEVETFLIPSGAWHLRLHSVKTQRPLKCIEGGFAIAKPDFGAFTEHCANGAAFVRTATDISIIACHDVRTPRVLSPFSNTNVIAPRTLVPQLRGGITPGITVLCAAIYAGPVGAHGTAPPSPEAPDIAELRQLFAEKGKKVPVFDLG